MSALAFRSIKWMCLRVGAHVFMEIKKTVAKCYVVSISYILEQ